jgi:hypothetical protein
MGDHPLQAYRSDGRSQLSAFGVLSARCRGGRADAGYVGAAVRSGKRQAVTRPLAGSSQTSPGWTGGAASVVNDATQAFDEPGSADRKIWRYLATRRRFAALGRTTQTAATRYGAPSSIMDLRSAASATFRFVLRMAAPRSPKVFHASSMSRTRLRASLTQTSIEWRGSAGRVGSSNDADRPVARASPSRRSCIARWPASVGSRGSPSGRERVTASGRSSATPSFTQSSRGTALPWPSSIRLIQVWVTPTRPASSSWVNRR